MLEALFCWWIANVDITSWQRNDPQPVPTGIVGNRG